MFLGRLSHGFRIRLQGFAPIPRVSLATIRPGSQSAPSVELEGVESRALYVKNVTGVHKTHCVHMGIVMLTIGPKHEKQTKNTQTSYICILSAIECILETQKVKLLVQSGISTGAPV